MLAGGKTSGVGGEPPDRVALAVGAVFLVVCAVLASAHQVGGMGVEIDFYGSFVADAARIRRGLVPLGTFSGPGYPALLALTGGVMGDDFAAAKVISTVAAALAAAWFYAAFRQVVSARVARRALIFLLAGAPFVKYAVTASSDMLALAFMAGALCFAFRGSARDRLIAGVLTGLGYLTRYNVAVLIPAFLLSLAVLNPLGESPIARLRAAVLYLVAAAVVASPWFWICWRQTGDPLHNRGYLNVAMEMNGLGSQDDDFVRVARRYHSLGDVVREQPARFAIHLARNAYQRVRQNLDQLVPFPLSAFAPAGLLLALLALGKAVTRWGNEAARPRASPSDARLRAGFALYALTFYLSLTLVDGRPRYYLFLLPFYTLAAVHFLAWAVGREPRAARCLLSVCLLFTLWGTCQSTRSLLASEPRELARAARRLRELGRPGEKVMARTCHVGAIAGLETEWLPDVPDLAALGRRLAARRVSYLAYGPSEQSGRPQLAALREPARAPSWLSPIYVGPSGDVALYRVLSARLPRPRASETYVTPNG
jgi:hypothetical protein